ncbi:DUF4012 domain-containing protein [Jidongwangia harbinensis]|uniref:DUF4012 domain-containing protein n=1 Tax=Jidongwangia harbinensis TaxID=2878561 RepID=UPI001CD97BBC|nr:DUF4012 domain-containing protein [Jidongwangia harbinensis]MCA2214078.1 DUF4012 domain-containing protein [Jidongwangia harbinensis]
MPETEAVQTPARPVRRRRRWFVVLAAGLVLVLFAAGTLWVGVRARNARDHLVRAAALVQQLRGQLVTGDPAATGTLAALQRSTAAARAETADPGWSIGGRLPVVGDEFTAVRTVAAALDDLARDGLPPLVATAATTNPAALTPRNGRIDLAPLQAAAPRLRAADTAVRAALDRVTAIPAGGLSEPVRSAVAELTAKLGEAAAVTTTANRSAAALPTMLGAYGARTYLVLFQNPAEIRATGGLSGAYVVVRADRGAVAIVDQGAPSEWVSWKRPVLPLTASDRTLWTDRLGTFFGNVNLTPHFPTAAALAREMYRRRSGRAVDGVLTTDPVALSYLLGAVGTVPVPGGPALTAEAAVPILLSRMYRRDVTLEQQDAFFARAARAAFEAVTSRRWDAAQLLAALARAAGERRLLVWSARPAENRWVAGTVLSGVLPADDGERPTVGVFLNDGSGAKLGYYLRQAARVTAGRCRGDGRRELTVRVELRSTAPRSGLSRAVTGLGLAGDPYTVRTVVAVYSPAGGSLERMHLDGEQHPFGSGLDRGRAVGQVVVDVPPGGHRTLDVTLVTGVYPAGRQSALVPRLWTTPAVAPWEQSVETPDGCKSGR